MAQEEIARLTKDLEKVPEHENSSVIPFPTSEKASAFMLPVADPHGNDEVLVLRNPGRPTITSASPRSPQGITVSCDFTVADCAGGSRGARFGRTAIHAANSEGRHAQEDDYAREASRTGFKNGVSYDHFDDDHVDILVRMRAIVDGVYCGYMDETIHNDSEF
jgi:hypothetical protein